MKSRRRVNSDVRLLVMITIRHLSKSVLVAVVGVLFVSCAPDRTSVVIKQGNPQQFSISGCGTFDILTISGPDFERPHNGNPSLKDYWVIQSINDIDVSRLPNPIVYGQVPSGFRQYTPAHGLPPPISEGNSYWITIGVRERRCGGVNMMFVVRDGKIIPVNES
jgi:hypothetical protein